MKVTLPGETINKVLGYLSTRPFQDVSQIIGEIQHRAEVIPEEGDEQPVTEPQDGPDAPTE